MRVMLTVFVILLVLSDILSAQVSYLQNNESNAVALSAGASIGSKNNKSRALGFETGQRKFVFGVSYSETKPQSEDKYDAVSAHIGTTFPHQIDGMNLSLRLGYLGSSKIKIPAKHVVFSPSIFLNIAHKITADSFIKIIPEAGVSRLFVFEEQYEGDLVSSVGVTILYNRPTMAFGLGLSRNWSSGPVVNLLSFSLITD